jgi:hypothetical protein
MTDPYTLLAARIETLESRVRHLETVVKAHDRPTKALDPVFAALEACQDQLRGEMTASQVASIAGLSGDQRTLNAVSRHLNGMDVPRKRTNAGRLFVFSNEPKRKPTAWMQRAINLSGAALAGTMTYDQILWALKLPRPDASVDKRIRDGLASMGAVEFEPDTFKFGD